MRTPDPATIKAMAMLAGAPANDEEAARIARSIGPAVEAFAPVTKSLPFDLEPATFVAVQLAGATR
jgi:hypothetical protein